MAAAPEDVNEVPEVHIRPMMEIDLGEVAVIEQESYAFPWSENIFRDCLRVGYTWSDGKYEAALFGRNITDEEVAVGGIDFDNLTGFLNEPQIWGVQFKAKF